MRDFEITDLHEPGYHNCPWISCTIALGGVIRQALTRKPGNFITEDIQQTLSQTDVERYSYRSISFQQQSAKSRAGSNDPLGRIDDVHIVQEGNIQYIFFPRQIHQFLQGTYRHLPRVKPQALMWNRVPCGFNPKFICIIL